MDDLLSAFDPLHAEHAVHDGSIHNPASSSSSNATPFKAQPLSTSTSSSRARRPSLGFSPPRRLSRSGLMLDENRPSSSSSSMAYRNPAASPTIAMSPSCSFYDSAFPTTALSTSPTTSYTPTLIDLHSPRVGRSVISTSPPQGSALESMRSSSYFASIGQHSRRTSGSVSTRPVLNGLFEPSSGGSTADPAASTTTPTLYSRGASSMNHTPIASTSYSPTTARLGNSASNSINTARPIPLVSKSHSPDHIIILPSLPDDLLAAPTSRKPKSSTFDFGRAFSEPSSPFNAPLTSTTNGRRHDANGNGRESTQGMMSQSLTIGAEPLPSVTLNLPPGISNTILNEDIVDGVRAGLTSRLRLQKNWKLLYSLDAHGTSLTTLYAKVQAGLLRSAGGCLLCIRDMRGGTYGAYVNEAFRKQENYYGNGDCFLWKVEQFPANDQFRVGPIVRIYRWTGRNDYMILSDGKSLSVGGGNGKFGIWIDSSLNKGFSTVCPAFDNEVLCAKTGQAVDGTDEGKFDIMAVECWAID